MDNLPADYEITEADIDKMIHYLQVTMPEDTITPEMAIEKLEEMYENFHSLAHSNPKLLERWYEEIQPSEETTMESDR